MSGGFLDDLNTWEKDTEKRQSRERVALPILHLPPILTLKEGQTTIRVLSTKPVCRFVHYVQGTQGKKHPVVCPGEGCLFCNRGVARDKYAYGYALDRSDGQIKVLPFTKKLVKELKDLVKKTGDPDLSNYDIVITRTGKGFGTRYRVDKSENTEPVQVDTAQLPDLENELRPMPVAEQKEYFQEGLQAQEAEKRAFKPEMDGLGKPRRIEDYRGMFPENKVQQPPAIVPGAKLPIVDEDSVS